MCTPMTGSIPISTSEPFPTCHASWQPSQGRVWRKPFQMTETPRVPKVFLLSQSTTERPFKYLLVRTRCQRLLFISTIHRFLRRRAVLNQYKFLIPQPSFSFGQEKICQLVKWYLRLLPVEPHKKANIMLLSLWRMDKGMGANPNQYTRILDSTAWTNIKRPPSESNL